MGLRDTFESLRDKLRGDVDEQYYDDEYEDDDYDEGYDDEDFVDDDEDEGYDDDEDDGEAEQSHGLLGNTPRPEADSVSVFTRSGRPLTGNSRLGGHEENAAYVPHAPSRSYEGPTSPVRMRSHVSTEVKPSSALGPVSAPKSRRATQSNLPPYVLRPVSYEDVQVVIRRVRTKQPVILVLENTRADIAKRILDFCLGLACGVGGSVDEIDQRSFVIVPADVVLTADEIKRALVDPAVKR